MIYEIYTNFNNFLNNKLYIKQKLRIFEVDRIVYSLEFHFFKLFHINFFFNFLLICGFSAFHLIK